MELLRELVGRIGLLVRRIKGTSEKSARLRFALLKESDRPGIPDRLLVKGLTRDLSETGLSLCVPSMVVDVGHLATQDHLLVKLELPAGEIVTMRASLIRYHDLEQGGYLMGIRIMEMSEHDRLSYEAYFEGI